MVDGEFKANSRDVAGYLDQNHDDILNDFRYLQKSSPEFCDAFFEVFREDSDGSESSKDTILYLLMDRQGAQALLGNNTLSRTFYLMDKYAKCYGWLVQTLRERN